MFTVVSVYILNLPSHLDRPFDYYVPTGIDKNSDIDRPPQKGDIITVPFGGGNKHMAALVTEVKVSDDIERLKPVISPAEITLTDEEFGLVFFLKEHTFCSVGDALKTVIPQAVMAGMYETYRVVEENPLSPYSVNHATYFVYQYIYDETILYRRRPPTLAQLIYRFGEDVKEVLPSLVKLGYIKTYSEIKKSSNIKNISYYSIPASLEQLEEKIEKQKLRSSTYREIINYIAEHGIVSGEEIKSEAHATQRQLDTLVERKLLSVEKKENYRNPYKTDLEAQAAPPLTECQEKAFEQISVLTNTGKPEAVLLHGITGSGKTRVIKEVIDKVLSENKQVIMLVPEIALTPQTVDIFCSYYKNRVAVIHSSLSSGEKYDAWRRIKRGEVSLCIGTRSAVFAPFSRLGMIIIDEEHEHTYKSDQTPHYNAIDIARYRVAYNKALLLLASATPSLESYYKAENGLYKLVEMNERVKGATLPETIITDLRADAESGNTSPIGLILRDALENTLTHCEQSIFFINRRGYNNFLNCPMCGYVVTCPHCSVSLTHHIRNKKSSLVCHYCGYTQEIPQKCPECSSDAFAFIGFGTQFAEDAINKDFPDASVMRMDADTTSQKFSYDKMLSDFRKEKYDILLGTQMVTKGHDFPNVTLVGILLADTTLYLDDYRACERTFQLVTQVIGRAGRSDKHGRAIIQTYNPNHPSLLLAASQDYKAFYKEEIAMRKALVFPPFCDMALISISSKDETFLQKAVSETSSNLKKLLNSEFKAVKLIVFGPFEAPIYKVKETYRMRFVIKCKSNKETRAMFRTLLNKTLSKFGKKVSVTIDINPNNL